MERRKLAVKCRENEELAEYMLTKWQEMADQRPKGISENIEKTLSKAYSNLCSSKNPVQTLKDFSQIKGVGKWILKHMQGFFKTDLSIAEPENLTKNGKKTKRATRYLPQKYSVAYALLITLYRGIENGNEFMRKQELIDAAEASGLSRVPIAPEMGKGKPGSFGSSPREWYSGWTSMKTLVTKGLVVKSSCPAKYMLTQEGKEAARECISRSGLPDPSKDTSTSEGLCDPGTHNMQDIELVQSDSESDVEVMASPVNLRRQKPMDISPDYLERGQRSRLDGQGFNILSMPPLSFGEIFEDAYEVVLVLDDREQFANKGSRSSKIIESVSSQFKIKIEVRRLPVGDGIWIARHKYLGREYVLDFIVERKKIGDLRSSIRDNRYRDQKLRLLRCGLKKLIYLVEGDPNYSEAAESIKTACFTTEILEGFDVQRTSGLSDTLKKYGHLTQAITEYYKTQIPEEVHEQTRVCPPFKEFIKKCEELDKMTVNDLFAIQLMQVQQVTEEVAMAVVDLYPTILSLASAYSLLEGDIAAQQDMLRKQSNNVVSAAASRNIFQLIWGN
ncbi:crossover junction endonuclease MUS81 isoform X2 [Morus notabilis]|uniref:crossover junction endonuclease MUS81 isoform X2 n=1 Tax=Morus notabilis TaxID=981085 RepID=UPI000CED6207|nr:crossover junction endonuclease MUS81 isoform X2 [Morus notabilis]